MNAAADDPAEGKRPTVLDLFAGVGGLSLGLEQAGFSIAAALELDPVHALTHTFNFPTTPVIWGDANTTSASELLDVAGRVCGRGSSVDAVVGGPPCQGFSSGGVRDDDDARNQNLIRFVEIVTEIRPRVFCLENVSGLLEPRFDELRDGAFNRLKSAGYDLSGTDFYVNAKDFGVPQSRKRVIVLGGLDGAPKLRPPTLDEEVSVGAALQGLPDVSRYWHLLRSDAASLKPEDIELRNAITSPYARQLAGIELDPDDYAHDREWDPTFVTASLRTVHSARSVARFSRTAPGRVEPRSRLFRLDPGGVARTLRAGTGTDRGSHTSPRPIHPTKNRVITVREAARLHGYPDWFRFNGTNWHGHRQVGNSVPPPLARVIGRALMEALGSVPSKAQPSLALGNPTWLRMPPKAAGLVLRQR